MFLNQFYYIFSIMCCFGIYLFKSFFILFIIQIFLIKNGFIILIKLYQRILILILKLILLGLITFNFTIKIRKCWILSSIITLSILKSSLSNRLKLIFFLFFEIIIIIIAITFLLNLICIIFISFSINSFYFRFFLIFDLR